MGWAVEAVADYAENVRPRFGFGDHPALWVTERGGRVKPAEINARFESYREALRLPPALSPHSLRHSYVTHLTEDGVDRRFIQVQVGHECDSSTAIYTKSRELHLTGEVCGVCPHAEGLNTALAAYCGSLVTWDY
jgi:integrase/recombinase XerC